MRLVQAASFDIWLTLLKSNPDFKHHRNENLRQTFAPEMPFESFDGLLRTYDRQADHLAEESGEDYDFIRRLKLMFREQNIPHEAEDPRFLHCLQVQEELVEEFPPRPYTQRTPDLLHAISHYIPLAVTSNTGMLPGPLMRRLLATAGYGDSFTVHTFSDEVAASKPSVKIFKATLAGLGTPASNTVHLGDNPRADILGGANAGMLTVLVNQENAPSIETALDRLLLEVEA